MNEASVSKPRDRVPISGQQGSVLVLVLVVSTILLLAAAFFAGIYRQGVRGAGQLLDKLQARVSSESALQVLLYYGATGGFTSRVLYNRTLPEELQLPRFLDLAGAPVTIVLHGNPVELRLQDSAGLLNIWFASSTELRNLLLLTGASREEAVIAGDSLQDWRDRDDAHHLQGAEKWYYSREKRFAYGPRNSLAIQNLDELSLLRGMGPERYRAIRPYLAISPKNGRNPATMPPLVLAAALGIDAEGANGTNLLLQLSNKRDRLTNEEIQSIIGQNFARFGEGAGFPSRTVRAGIVATVGDARADRTAWLHFVPDVLGPYRILHIQEGVIEGE